jgi:hypothetical protein
MRVTVGCGWFVVCQAQVWHLTRVNALSLPQKNELAAELDEILVALARFDMSVQAETASVPVSESVDRAKRAIWLN